MVVETYKIRVNASVCSVWDSHPYLLLASPFFYIKLPKHINWKLSRRRFTHPNQLWYFLALSQHSYYQRYAPYRCFLIVTYALSLLKGQDTVNNPKINLWCQWLGLNQRPRPYEGRVLNQLNYTGKSSTRRFYFYIKHYKTYKLLNPS